MTRYLRLYAYFLRFSFSRAMEFRVDFFFRVIMDTAFYAVNLGFFSVIYRHTGSIAGWNFDQSVVFVSGFFLIDAIHMTLFANNMWWLPIFVNRGDVDYYLVRPVSSLFFLSLRDFAANSFLNLLVAGGLLSWALLRYTEPLGPGRVAVYIALLVLGAVLYWTIYMLFMIPVFWIHSDYGLRQLFMGLSKFAERPDVIYRGWLRRILISCLPVAIIASFPARVIFDGVKPEIVLHVVGVVAGMFLLMLWCWGRALRAYSSASS